MTFKLKVNPEDFIVSEVIKPFTPGEGSFSLYLLRKINLSTWDALGRLSKTLHIPLKHFGYGGLKDKKAITYQYITIKNGPKRDIHDKNIELTYLGNLPKSLDKSDLLGNNFEITLRQVTLKDEIIEKNIEEVRLYGIPNYFDEQRFGSVSENREFAVKEIIRGNYERALFLIMAIGSPDDIAQSRALRDCLKRNWRNWDHCVRYAHLKWERELLHFLSKKTPSQRTFKRALNLVDQEYLFFLGNVYQSYLWNEVLREILIHLGLNHFTIPYQVGEFCFYRKIPNETFKLLQGLKIPYPSPKIHVEERPELPLKELYLKVLSREGFMDFKDLRTFIKGLVFKTYPRPAIVFPRNLVWERLEERIVRLKFFLEKGSFATIVIKRVFYGDKNS